MTDTFLLKFGSWYLITTLSILAALSIMAYRKTLKKIFILFMLISIPTAIDKIYTQIDVFSLQKFHNTIPNLILGRDIRESSQYLSESVKFIRYQKEQSDVWAESIRKQNELKAKYADAIAEQKKRTWLKDFWNNIVWRLSSWLFPIASIIVCLNELKSSNQWFTRKTPDE